MFFRRSDHVWRAFSLVTAYLFIYLLLFVNKEDYTTELLYENAIS